jgi:membrane protease subunit (stomatin/prohibitin family)
MMAGAGLGAGFGMANMMMGAMQQPGQQGQQPQQPAAPAAAPSAGGTVQCPGCKANVAPGKFCAECGTNLSPAPRFCPSCGTPGAPGSKFCMNCGTGYPA